MIRLEPRARPRFDSDYADALYNGLPAEWDDDDIQATLITLHDAFESGRVSHEDFRQLVRLAKQSCIDYGIHSPADWDNHVTYLRGMGYRYLW